jgi:hypothetical protein
MSSATVAIAIDESVRHVFVSVDRRLFSRVGHFPASAVEAKRLASDASGPTVSREQLVALYAAGVTLVRLESP